MFLQIIRETKYYKSKPIIIPLIVLLPITLLYNYVSLWILSYIQFALMLLFIPIWRRYSITRFIINNNPEDAAILFEFSKKVLRFTLAPLIVSISLYYVFIFPAPHQPLTVDDLLIPAGISPITIAYQIYIVTFATSLPMIYNLYFGYLRTKDFEFKLAKGWLKTMSKENDDFNKMKYFSFGMNYYNKYLRRTLKVEIN